MHVVLDVANRSGASRITTSLQAEDYYGQLSDQLDGLSRRLRAIDAGDGSAEEMEVDGVEGGEAV